MLTVAGQPLDGLGEILNAFVDQTKRLAHQDVCRMPFISEARRRRRDRQRAGSLLGALDRQEGHIDGLVERP